VGIDGGNHRSFSNFTGAKFAFKAVDFAFPGAKSAIFKDLIGRLNFFSELPTFVGFNVRRLEPHGPIIAKLISA